MATISTIDDFIRVLDENPAWREAVRSRILTKELLELPDRFARFVEHTEEFRERTEAFMERTEAFMERTEAFMEATDRRFEEVDRRIEETNRRFEAFVERTEAFMARTEAFMEMAIQRFEAIDRRFERIEQRLDKVESDIQGIRDDLGPLKAAHARNAAVREADLIAEDMGFTLVRRLTYEDIGALVRAQDTAGIPRNELVSFRRADLIVAAQDADDQDCYLAIEISFTANGRDTERALRNAELLQQFTGLPAYAAVAGLRRDDRIKDVISERLVRWHQLDPVSLGVE